MTRRRCDVSKRACQMSLPLVAFQFVISHLDVAQCDECLVPLRSEIVHLPLRLVSTLPLRPLHPTCIAAVVELCIFWRFRYLA
jgi:hypothetical protein